MHEVFSRGDGWPQSLFFTSTVFTHSPRPMYFSVEEAASVLVEVR